jgi:hypothetical protein
MESSMYPAELVPAKNSAANHESLPTAMLPVDGCSKLDRYVVPWAWVL